MKRITHQIGLLAVVVGVGASSLLVAKPAAALPLQSNQFWGNAAGSLTGTLINGAIHKPKPPQTTVIYQQPPTQVVYPSPVAAPIVYPSSVPPFQVLNYYGLTQTYCSKNVVVIKFPSQQVVCGLPTAYVPAGPYEFNPFTRQLVQTVSVF